MLRIPAKCLGSSVSADDMVAKALNLGNLFAWITWCLSPTAAGSSEKRFDRVAGDRIVQTFRFSGPE